MDEDTDSADGLVRQIETLQGALHNLQSKYDRLQEANERITAHCSALAEENSNLRGHHQLDDDSSLRDKFQELDFAIRSWCIGLRDTKQNVEAPFTLPVPSQDANIIYQFKTEAAELNFLISGVWEWLVMLSLIRSLLETTMTTGCAKIFGHQKIILSLCDTLKGNFRN
jgi:hypothetical protein